MPPGEQRSLHTSRVLARLCAAWAAPQWQWTAEPDTEHVLV